MSKKITLTFLRSGLLTTIQDAGRLGYQHLGIPIGGIMDEQAAKMANKLVDNRLDTPVLEITLMGPTIRFGGACQIALTGAHLSPTLDGNKIKHYQTINVQANQILSFGKNRKGCRCYLAIRGTWLVKKWLSSYSAASTNSHLLTPQSMLTTNSKLTIETAVPIAPKKIAKGHQLSLPSSVVVRVARAPEFECFSHEHIAFFFSQLFTLSNQSNRMGCRLNEVLPEFNPQKPLISSGVLPGTIQIANNGQPIILMKDAQTTGGYYRIAQILSEDLNKIAQLKPTDSIRFSFVSLKN